MKRILTVFFLMMTGTFICAGSEITLEAIVGNGSRFPGVSTNMRAMSNSFPPGTMLQVTKLGSESSVEVEVVSRHTLSAMHILIEESAAAAIGLPKDRPFPVLVVPVSNTLVSRPLPFQSYDYLTSRDPDINPTAESYMLGVESTPPPVTDMDDDPPQVQPVEPVEDSSDEEHIDIVEDTSNESVSDIPVEPPFVEDKLADVAPDEPDTTDSDMDAYPSSLLDIHEGFEGELAEEPVNEYGDEIAGEFSEFSSEGTTEEKTLLPPVVSVPPYDDISDIDQNPVPVFDLSENDEPEIPESGTDEPPVMDDEALESYPLFTDGSPIIAEDDYFLTDDSNTDEETEPLIDDDSLYSDQEEPFLVKDDSTIQDDDIENKEYILIAAEPSPPDPVDTSEWDDDVSDNNESFIDDGLLSDTDPLTDSSDPLIDTTIIDNAPITDNTMLFDDWVETLGLNQVAPGTNKYYVQIGAYNDIDVMKDTIDRIIMNSPEYPLSYKRNEEGTIYRLLIGPLFSAEKAVVLRTIHATISPDAFHYAP